MTDLTFDSARATTVSNAERLWRALAFAMAFLGALVVLVWILQSRGSTDAAVTNSAALDVASTSVTVVGGPEEGASVAVLGLDRDQRTSVVNSSATLEIPQTHPSMLGLFADDQLIGLALSPGSTTEDLTISATSTARALLTLSPAGLLPDPAFGASLMQRIEQDDAFAELVAALTVNPVSYTHLTLPTICSV